MFTGIVEPIFTGIVEPIFTGIVEPMFTGIVEPMFTGIVELMFTGILNQCLRELLHQCLRELLHQCLRELLNQLMFTGIVEPINVYGNCWTNVYGNCCTNVYGNCWTNVYGNCWTNVKHRSYPKSRKVAPFEHGECRIPKWELLEEGCVAVQKCVLYLLLLLAVIWGDWGAALCLETVRVCPADNRANIYIYIGKHIYIYIWGKHSVHWKAASVRGSPCLASR